MLTPTTNDLIPPVIRQKLSKIKKEKEKDGKETHFLDELLDKKFVNNYFNKNAK
jgi:hypothetical protein